MTLFAFLFSVITAGVAAADSTNAANSAAGLLSTGESQFQHQQYADALQSYQKALALFQQSGDRDGEAKALMSIGLVQVNLSGYAHALQSEQQALTLFRQQNDRVEAARTLLIIGFLQGGHGQETVALQLFEQALALFQELGDRDGEERTLNNIGITQSKQGEDAAALQSFEQALALDRQLHHPDAEAETLLNIGILQASQNQFSDALQSYRQALALFQQVGDQANAAIAEHMIDKVQPLTSQSPQPSPTPTSSPATQAKFTSQDIATLLRAVQDSGARSGITINVVVKEPSQMPSYDPVVHFAGLDASPTSATIWTSQVSTTKARAEALWAAVELACMATGFAGPKWKSIYDTAAALDAAQPPGSANPYKYRLGLTQQIKATLDADNTHQ